MTSTLVERVSAALDSLLSRRNFITRSAFVGSAVAIGAGLDLALRPGTAYGQICSCGNTGCNCGSTCCSGFSEFCCSVNGGYNYCPSDTVMAGWWKADNSSYCSGPRYYMDCNAKCACDTGCGNGFGFCETGCDGLTCGCGSNSCDHYLTGCLQFRYGQCNQDLSCIGRIVCRVVACIPPWEIDPTCTTTVAVDEGTAEQDAPCWTDAPPEPPPGEKEDDMPNPLTWNGAFQFFDVDPSGNIVQRWQYLGQPWAAAVIGSGCVPNKAPMVGTSFNQLHIFASRPDGTALHLWQNNGGAVWSSETIPE
jgi:hypothetical protein